MLTILNLMRSKLIAYVIAALIVAELLLVLISWFLSSLMVDGVRSLLSSEGIRWFFGQFTDMILSPVLGWLLLLAVSTGVFRQSGLLTRPSTYRERMNRMLTLLVLLLYCGVILLLTSIPHAILLSPTGALFPSPFSRALVPIIALGILVVSLVYGISVRVFTSVVDVCQAMSQGISWWSPVLLLYVFFMQLYESVCFVFF